MSNINRSSVCAVIVVYYPDNSFEQRLDSLLQQVELLVIVDNSIKGIISNNLKKLSESNSKIIVVQNFSNLGISKALNQGLQFANKFECKWLLTLDQDTCFYNNIVESLLDADKIVSSKVKVIGGNYFDTHNDKHFINEGSNVTVKEVKTVITSGCLIDVVFSLKIGGFREDYFIDQVDHEFCLRVRSHGYKVVISNTPVMEHCVGEKGGARLPLLGSFPNHSPVRKYYIARNSITTIKKYWRNEPIWCVLRFVKLQLGFVLILVCEKQKLSKTSAFFKGIIDAMRNRLGECKHQWIV